VPSERTSRLKFSGRQGACEDEGRLDPRLFLDVVFEEKERMQTLRGCGGCAGRPPVERPLSMVNVVAPELVYGARSGLLPAEGIVVRGSPLWVSARCGSHPEVVVGRGNHGSPWTANARARRARLLDDLLAASSTKSLVTSESFLPVAGLQVIDQIGRGRGGVPFEVG